MITEWLMGVGGTIATWFITLFPQGEVADFVLTMDDKVNSILAGLSGVGVWADWAYIIGVVGVVLAVWVIGIAVRVVLTLWKLIPVVGGG